MEYSFRFLGNKKVDQERMLNDPDYVSSKKHNGSLNAVLRRYPDGVSNKVAARMLDVSEVELEQIYQAVVLRLRLIMKVSLQE